MEIKWFGHSCFRITERGLASVVADPFDHKVVGYKALKLKAEVVTISCDEAGHNFSKAVSGKSWELRGPGEYEIGGVFITAVATQGDNGSANMAYVYDYGGVRVGHFGNIADVPKRSQLEIMGSINVALVPVGGENSLNASKAAEVISLIEPGLVVPMHYKTEASTQNLDTLSRFLQEMGLSVNEEAVESLKVSASSVPSESKVVVLKASA